MSHLSLLAQTTDALNMNNVVHLASIVKACEFLGISAGMHDSDLSNTTKDWLRSYGIKLHGSALGECEVLIRAFGLGMFPARPTPPKPLVVDLAIFSSWFPGDQDYGLAFYDGVFSMLANISVDIIAPLPQELSPVFRLITNRKIVVFLGTDPLSRAALIASSIISPRAPRILGSAKSGEAYSADLTAHPVSLPQGTQPGDLILVWSSFSGNPTVTLPAGWNLLAQANNGTQVKGVLYWRIADGTETRDIIVTTSSGLKSGHVAYRIVGGTTPILVSSAVVGATTTPDPPVLNPGTSLPRLWIALAAHNTGGSFGAPITAFPTNYSEDLSALSLEAAAEVTARRLTASSEDPGAFTKIGNTAWVALTVAIDPVASPYTSSVVGFSPYDFWEGLRSADIAVCSPGIPHLTAAALGIPSVVVANTALEDTNFTQVLQHGFQGCKYIGPLASLSDEAVADEAISLVDDLTRKHAFSAIGLLGHRKTGVRRISEWIVRDLVGSIQKQSPLFSFPVWPNVGPIPNPGGF